ncbi:MAG: (2Fe-2S)-binding protein [Solirubrobacterales bacterium]|nr:(2Fe-2S)-binding protein [Solirubrobacterales bacterium]
MSFTPRDPEGSRPIEAGVARIAPLHSSGYIPLVKYGEQPADQGWLIVGEVIDNPGLIERVVKNVQGIGSTPPRNIQAEWLLEKYAWTMGVVAGAFVVGVDRLPQVGPDQVMFHGLGEGVAILEPQMFCLESDYRADHPDLTPVPDEAALAAPLKAALNDHLERLISTLTELKTRPAAALWRAAGDKLAEAFLWCGTTYDKPERARRLMEQILGEPGRLHNRLGVGIDSFGEEFHLRESCCLAYRMPGSRYCQGCPLAHAA